MARVSCSFAASRTACITSRVLGRNRAKTYGKTRITGEIFSTTPPFGKECVRSNRHGKDLYCVAPYKRRIVWGESHR